MRSRRVWHRAGGAFAFASAVDMIVNEEAELAGTLLSIFGDETKQLAGRFGICFCFDLASVHHELNDSLINILTLLPSLFCQVKWKYK